MDIAVEFIPPRWSIAHGHGHDVLFVQHIIEIISAVWPLRHVRGIEAGFPLPVQGILIPGVDHALVAPVREILQRGGPAHIIPHAEHESIVKVMGTIDIDPVSEDMGLTVRYVLPGRQIRVEGLFLHFRLPPFRVNFFSESSGPIQHGFQAPVTKRLLLLRIPVSNP